MGIGMHAVPSPFGSPLLVCIYSPFLSMDHAHTDLTQPHSLWSQPACCSQAEAGMGKPRSRRCLRSRKSSTSSWPTFWVSSQPGFSGLTQRRLGARRERPHGRSGRS